MSLVHFDSNVLKPISQRGHEKAYEQFEALLLNVAPDITNKYQCYSVVDFFEHIGKGTLWTKINMYKGISIPLEMFNDRKKLAEQISNISEEILKRLQNYKFFSKENIVSLYQKCCADFIGNNKSTDLLDSTFHRFGEEVCDPKSDLLHMFKALWWDRLVSFPVLWNKPEDIQNKLAKEKWEKAKFFYDCLFASYFHQKIINLNMPFTKLVLHRRFIDHLLRLKHLRHEIKKSNGLRLFLNRYQICRLEEWVENYRWAFKPNRDLVDVNLLHWAIYGFYEDNGEGIFKGIPVTCITCDPLEVIEKRLFLCMTSNDELYRQVEGWDLSLCPGKIICLEYKDQEFSHVKTIDVKKNFQEQNSSISKSNRRKLKLELCKQVYKESMKG